MPDSEFECTIESVAYGGDGIARVNGRVVFIPGVIAGERVRARIVAAKKNFARGEAIAILSASPDRIQPCCRTQSGQRVPGCVYDHIAYSAQVALKDSQLRNFFRKLTLGTAIFQPPVASPKPLHYRNKITLHHDPATGALGYCEDRSHRVVPIDCCPLACDEINSAAVPENCFRPEVEDVIIRYTPADGARVFLKCFGRRDLLTPGGQPVRGNLTEQGPDGTQWAVSADGFFQVNPSVSWKLVEEVTRLFAEGSPEATAQLLDLYCGVGVFGLSCQGVGRGTALLGIESGYRAVEAARLNAQRLGRTATFQVAELGRTLPKVPPAGTLIADPPREGLDPAIAAWLARSNTRRLFYVSCDPATLIRDVGILTQAGAYQISRIQLFDMFPQTAHFETLCILEETNHA